MAKPGTKITFRPDTNVTADADALIDKMQAAATAFDAAVSFTDETLGGDKVASSVDLDYVDFQSEYGRTLMAILVAFRNAYDITFTTEAIEI